MSNVRDSSDAWLAEHGRFLRRLAGAVLADESRADDVAQDAWVAALEAAPPRHLAGWLVTVTRRLAGRSGRDADRRRQRERSAARTERLPAADSVAARAEIVRIVGDVVADLPEPFRETLLLRYWEGLAPRRIAAETGVPVATVQSRTRRGLERVRADLARRAPGERWEEILALAVGLPWQRAALEASTSTTTLGAITLKTKTWIVLGGAALLLATLATNVVRWGPASTDEAAEPSELALRGAAPSPRGPAEPSADRPAERRAVADRPAPAVRPAPELSVLVVDASGEPVEGADLACGPTHLDLRVVATTTGAGRASLEVTEGLRVLRASADGWAPSPVYELPAPGAAEELLVQLPLRGVALTVEVRGPTGQRLPGARVSAGRGEEVDYRLPNGTLARTAPRAYATTDGAGVARFPALEAGWLRVTAEHDAHAAATTFATLEPGRSNRVEIELPAGFVVEGRVRDEQGGPVAGARIERTSVGTSATSAADGAFRLGPIPAGKVVAEGPLGRRVEARLDAGSSPVVRWDPVLPSRPALRGRVVDSLGAPLTGWWVHANDDTWPGWRRGAETDGEGRFAIYGTPARAMRVEVRAREGDALPRSTLEAVEAGPDELRIEVPTAALGRLQGRVERADGSVPARLPLYLRHATTPGLQRLTGGPGRPIPLDADGRFDLPGVPAASYELVLEGGPYGWYRLGRCALSAGATTDAGRLVVPEPGILRARSRRGGARTARCARFLLERRADRVTVLSFRGSFPAELRLAPGAYTLQTEVSPGPLREIEFEIRAGRVTPVELDLSSTCRHRVRVSYASGRAPVGAVSLDVRLVEDGSSAFAGRFAEVDAGAWVADVELDSGRYELVARDADGMEARVVEGLFTSRPGREVALSFDDRGGR